MKLFAATIALTLSGSGDVAWNRQSPNRNADAVIRLFSDVCVEHLGRSDAMHPALERSRAGFQQVYAGNEVYGPVWDSPHGRINATDHRHNHDGDECELSLRRSVAPNAEATIAALRRHGLVTGRGEPAEFGATAFRRGDTLIFVRYDIPEGATELTEADAGLTLLIQRPPG